MSISHDVATMLTYLVLNPIISVPLLAVFVIALVIIIVHQIKSEGTI